MAPAWAASAECAGAPLRWQLWDDTALRAPAAQVALDDDLLETAVAARCGWARIWSNSRCLVAPPGEVVRAGFGAACERSAQAGWRVVPRSSGGTVVPHTEGMLHLSMAFCCLAEVAPGIEALYRQLCAPVLAALARLGVAASVGAVPGAFCDGRFDLVADSRKIAGTAQRRWRRGAHEAVLAHLMLLIDGDMRAPTEAANGFYVASGRPAPFHAEAAMGVCSLVKPALRRHNGPLLPTVRAVLRQELESSLCKPRTLCLR